MICKFASSLFGAVLLLSAPACIGEAVSLFDGKTLEGWNTVERDQPFWSVAEGAIRADSLGKKMPRNTFLFSDKEYDNFTFTCKFRLTGKPETGMVNSGIQFRSAKHKNGSAKGYQADIGEPKWWGCLYDEHRRGLIAKSDMSKLKDTLKPFGWNDYKIEAIGPVIRLYLNGIQTIEYIEKDPEIPAKGHFALQLHSGGICRIEYKDIQLKAEKHTPPASEKKSSQVNLSKKAKVFADFEDATYKGWTVEGDAFGAAPLRRGKAPEHQGYLNGQGRYLVNSHASATGSSAERDAFTGKLTSEPFTIEHRYIQMLIGGGNHKGKTCVNVVADGKVIASLTGDNKNHMEIKHVDVAKFKGQEARIEIVDDATGGWGNIGVDQIVFTDEKPSATKPKPKKLRGSRSVRTDAWTPEEQRKGFTVPEGFSVELVASEEHGVINPIDLTFDDAGRLWTGTARMYPLDPDPEAAWQTLLKYMENPELAQKDERFKRNMSLYARETKGEDKIIILNDLNKPSSATVWAEGMAIPQSVLPYKNGAYVAHGSEMLYLEDTDNDGKADKQTSVLHGYGFSDTHTMAHLLVRAPGGWVHYAHGALNKGNVLTVLTRQYDRVDYALTARFSLDNARHNVVVRGLNNIWGYQLRASGQWYGQEANDKGHSVTPMEPGTAYGGIGRPKIRDYQPLFPSHNKFSVGGTGLSGLAFADDRNGGFPEEFQGVAFLANPITCKINAVRIKRNPDGSVTSEHLPDFLTSADDWFRPVNIEFGPDGCLYIADFYNKIISHNEVSRSHPDRDKTHGRIWRVRYKTEKGDPVNVAAAGTKDLPKHLDSGTLQTQRAAWHQIVDRNAQQLVPELIRISADKANHVSTRIHALWSLEGLGRYDADLMDALLKDADDDLRREALRALGSMPISASDLAARLKPFVEDPNAMIRSQVLRTIADYGKASPQMIDVLVSACKEDSKGKAIGGDYERKFERYLARMALEQYQDELARYLDSSAAEQQPAVNIGWASQALSLDAKAKEFLSRWPAMKDRKLTDAEFLELCVLARNDQVKEAAKSIFTADDGNYLVELAARHPQQAASAALRDLLKPVVESMLQSTDAVVSRTAVRAADVLEIENLDDAVAAIYTGRRDDAEFAVHAINILARSPQKHLSTLSEAVMRESMSTEAMLSGFAAIASVDTEKAMQHAEKVLKSVPENAHEALAYMLAAKGDGPNALLALLKKGQMDSSVVDRTLVEMLEAGSESDRQVKALRTTVRKEREHYVKKASKRIDHLADLKGGDAQKGKPLFTSMCLSCHVVGGEGAGFAPALDGSGYRDREALLTAIVDPDAAAEGNYTLYRVFKNDGSKVEGYLESDTASGVRLRFMGGGSMAIARQDIAMAGFVSGRSVMPRGLTDELDDKQMSHLLAYIRSLR